MNDRFMVYFVPKTGGTWSRGAMRRGGVGGLSGVHTIPGVRPFGLRAHHATPEAVPEEYKDRFQFCFVRRPFQWYQSFWAFRMKAHAFDEDIVAGGGMTVLDYLWVPDFREFLSRVLCSCPRILTLMFQAFTGPDNDWMDFVGRQEELSDDLLTALRIAGYSDLDESRMRRLKPMNVTGREFKKQAKAPPHIVSKIEMSERWILDTFYD
jgi:hypothetical protein